MAMANPNPLSKSQNVDAAGATNDHSREQDMSPAQALRLAWIWWLSLLLAPCLLFLVVVWASLLGMMPDPKPAVAIGFSIASLVWLLIAVPGAFVLRNYCFKSYWEGRTVEPRSYVRGMLTIWVAPEIGGLLALVGCMASGQWMPCLLPAAVAFVLFTPFWPSGRAMVDPVGATDDDEVFRHPR